MTSSTEHFCNELKTHLCAITLLFLFPIHCHQGDVIDATAAGVYYLRRLGAPPLAFTTPVVAKGFELESCR